MCKEDIGLSAKGARHCLAKSIACSATSVLTPERGFSNPQQRTKKVWRRYADLFEFEARAMLRARMYKNVRASAPISPHQLQLQPADYLANLRVHFHPPFDRPARVQHGPMVASAKRFTNRTERVLG